MEEEKRKEEERRKEEEEVKEEHRRQRRNSITSKVVLNMIQPMKRLLLQDDDNDDDGQQRKQQQQQEQLKQLQQQQSGSFKTDAHLMASGEKQTEKFSYSALPQIAKQKFDKIQEELKIKKYGKCYYLWRNNVRTRRKRRQRTPSPAKVWK